MLDKECSPFTPGNPVSAELFVGRTRQIDEILRYVRQASSGKLENVFLVGDRGIGKSSLASFLNYRIRRDNLVAIHVFLGKGISSLEEMIKHILDEILREGQGQPWYDGFLHYLKGVFGESSIRELGAFGISLSFQAPRYSVWVRTRSAV
ncbi:MAG: ATP-binding protein [Pseudomonadota bacterium]